MTWKEEYLKILSGSTNDTANIEKAMSIKMANLPPSLYRYRSFDPDGRSLDSLRSGLTWLSSPLAFNDPFDSGFSISTDRLVKDINQKHLPDLLKQSGIKQDLTDAEFDTVICSDHPFDLLMDRALEKSGKILAIHRSQLKKSFFSAMNEYRDRTMDGFIQRIRDNLRICCFSENPTSILMWSHYADYHRGFYLKYSTDIFKSNRIFFRLLHPVIYRNEFLNATEMLFAENSVASAWIVPACIKARGWKYESEWRFIAPFGALNEKPTTSFGLPEKIILGPKISSGNKEDIIEIATSLGISVSQATLRRDHFEVVIE